MPYENKETLQRLLEKAIKDPEIQKGLQEVLLPEDWIINSLNSQAEEIWDSNRQYIKIYNELEKDFSQLISLLNPIRQHILDLNGPSLDKILLNFNRDQLFATLESYEKFIQDTKLHQVDEEVLKASQIVRNARIITDRNVLELTILPRLRTIINGHLNPSYEEVLKNSEAPGLAQLFDPAFEIPTEAKKKLGRLLNTMPGGSIGIAGPRGAGKTTLMQSSCGPSLNKLKNRKVLSLLTSAPVEYDTREFILHLFASICKRTLELEGTTDRGSSSPYKYSQVDRLSKSLSSLKLLPNITSLLERIIVPPLGAVGVVLVFLSLFLVVLQLWSSELGGYIKVFQIAPSQILNWGAFIIAIWFSLRLLTESLSIYVRETLIIDESDYRARLIMTQRLVTHMLSILGPVCRIIGVTFVLLSLFVAFLLSGYHQIDANVSFPIMQAVHILAVQPGQILIIGSVLLATSLVLPMSWSTAFEIFTFRSHHKDFSFAEEPQKPYPIHNTRQSSSVDELSVKAEQWLDRIRFQQSYSSGWSGSLTLPIAITGSTNEAISMAQNQLSLPEIIEGYRKFIELVSLKYEVIIGIDELDKIESGEKAQKFLNEIKAIFNIDGCFYLISISENAMSSFERRGLPFRDVFDSSFDMIVFVNYLNLMQAGGLIQRRVIGMPIPFVALCYCISGGLARDIIRTSRMLFDLVFMTSKRELSKLCSALLILEVRAKLHAATIAARDINEALALDQFLALIVHLESQLNTAEASDKRFQELLIDTFVPLLTKLGSSARKSESSNSLPLAIELGTYLYYVSTVLEVFTDNKMTLSIKEMEERGLLDSLVKARQEMAFNTTSARSLITNFRHSSKLQIPFSTEHEQ